MIRVNRGGFGITASLPIAALLVMQAAAVGSPVAPHAVQQSLGGSKSGGVIGHLKTILKIGSTVDPINGDQNPYGLAIAPVTAGGITAGDLLISNFNNGSPFNIQGLGTTVEDLHATPGSKPTRIAQDSRLTGPSELVTGTTDDFAWVSAFTANGVPIVGDTASGGVIDDLTGNGLEQPWGQTFSGTKGIRGVAAFYVSNSSDGSITRINITKKGAFTYDKIATGFSVNHGVPGTVLAPAGLTYDARADVLYIVDSNMNRLVAFLHPGNVPVGGIIVNPYGGFGGVSGSSARVVYAGKPLNAPISAALLYNGDVVVGNTANNRLIEITPTGSEVGNKLLDNGAAGALFGIAASGSSIANQKIYFNDDNTNTVEVLQQ
jgi:hypothetical protein